MVNENETPDPNDPADIIRTAGGNLLETVNGVNDLFAKLNAAADDLLETTVVAREMAVTARDEVLAARDEALAARGAAAVAREAAIEHKEAAIEYKEAAIEYKQGVVADKEVRLAAAESLRDLIGEALAAARALAAEAKKDD